MRGVAQGLPRNLALSYMAQVKRIEVPDDVMTPRKATAIWSYRRSCASSSPTKPPI